MDTSKMLITIPYNQYLQLQLLDNTIKGSSEMINNLFAAELLVLVWGAMRTVDNNIKESQVLDLIKETSKKQNFRVIKTKVTTINGRTEELPYIDMTSITP